jgi:hypothetical protein
MNAENRFVWNYETSTGRKINARNFGCCIIQFLVRSEPIFSDCNASDILGRAIRDIMAAHASGLDLQMYQRLMSFA